MPREAKFTVITKCVLEHCCLELNRFVTLHALVGWVDFLDLELVTRNVDCAFLQELLSCVLLVEGDETEVLPLVFDFVEGLLDGGDGAVLSEELFDGFVCELSLQFAHVDLALLGLGFLHSNILAL